MKTTYNQFLCHYFGIHTSYKKTNFSLIKIELRLIFFFIKISQFYIVSFYCEQREQNQWRWKERKKFLMKFTYEEYFSGFRYVEDKVCQCFDRWKCEVNSRKMSKKFIQFFIKFHLKLIVFFCGKNIFSISFVCKSLENICMVWNKKSYFVEINLISKLRTHSSTRVLKIKIISTTYRTGCLISNYKQSIDKVKQLRKLNHLNNVMVVALLLVKLG